MLRLYELPGCGACWRVTRVLEELGLHWESIVVNRWDRSEVVRLSGQPLVPVLVDGDEVIADSRRIIAHLRQRHGKPEPAEEPQRKGLLARLLE